MRNPCLTCAGLHLDKRRPECENCEARIAYASSFGSLSCSVPEVRVIRHIRAGETQQRKKEATMEKDKKKNPHLHEITDGAAPAGPDPFREKKICPACGDLKTLSCFSRHARTRDGLAKMCKACQGERIKGGYDAKKKAVPEWTPPAPPEKGGRPEDARPGETAAVDTGEKWAEISSGPAKDLADFHEAERFRGAPFLSEFLPAGETELILFLAFDDYPGLHAAICKQARKNFRGPDMEVLKIISDALGVTS